MGASVICFMVCTYYMMIMGWTLYYLGLSLLPEHPWTVYGVVNGSDANTGEYFV